MQIPLHTVEVFTTNVEEKNEAAALAALLLQLYPGCNISFDLDDCDRILRVQGKAYPKDIVRFMNDCGYECKVLE